MSHGSTADTALSHQVRIPPLGVAERTERQRSLLESARGDDAPHVFSTIARHSELYADWFPFCMRLLSRSVFPRRERELLILRTAWLSKAVYEWRHHVAIGRRAGLGDEEILAIAGLREGDWSERERLLLAAVDELHAGQEIGETTWRGLADLLTEEQLIELPMMVGHYVLLAGLLRSLRVPLEADAPVTGLPDPGQND